MRKVSNPQKTRDRLAAESLAWLKRDQERVEDPKLREFLVHIGEHLFDKQLSITSACDAYRIKQSTFRAALGQNPKNYLESLRIHIGKRLAAETQYPLDLVAELTGYTSSNSFRKAFGRVVGESFTNFKKHLKRLKGQSDSDQIQLETDILARIERLSLAEIKTLRNHIQMLYPEFGDRPPQLEFGLIDQPYVPPKYKVCVSELERLWAERIWIEIQGLPEIKQMEMIRRADHFSTPALFDLLRIKAVEEGRIDRARGVQVSRLALEAAMIAERPNAHGKSSLWARAWEQMSIELRLAFELNEAEDAIALAEIYLPKESDQLLAGKILQEKASLRWYQRRSTEGMAIIDEALGLLKKTDNKQALASANILRGILSRSIGETEDAKRDNRKALDYLKDEPDTDLATAAEYNLAHCYLEQGELDKAKALLSSLRQLAADASDRIPRHLPPFLDWLEGRINLEELQLRAASEPLFRARAGFQLVKSRWAELVAIDLAVVQFRLGRAGDAHKFAEEALPVLAKWKDQPGFDRSYKRLEGAIHNKLLTLDILNDVRDHSDRLARDPAGRSALKLKGLL